MIKNKGAFIFNYYFLRRSHLLFPVYVFLGIKLVLVSQPMFGFVVTQFRIYIIQNSLLLLPKYVLTIINFRFYFQL